MKKYLTIRSRGARIALVGASVFFAGTTIQAAEKPTFIVHTELIDSGFRVFASTLQPTERENALQEYLDDPLMKIVFTRYSSPSRSFESRVDRALYEDFVRQLWKGNEQGIIHPRMKLILPHYKWGLEHPDALAADAGLIKKQFVRWLDAAITAFPWQAAFVRAPTRPIHIVFLFDPGGSFPWVTESSGTEYIFVDLLQLRGSNDDDRREPVDANTLVGLLTHEILHTVQDDQNRAVTSDQWLIKTAVGEGAACLLGNNLPDSRGHRYDPKNPVRFPRSFLQEWRREIRLTPGQIQPFLDLVSQWKMNPPSEDEQSKMLTEGRWVAAPSNKLGTGNLYRVGAEMLLAIREGLGEKAFSDILVHSDRLLDYWTRLNVRSTLHRGNPG